MSLCETDFPGQNCKTLPKTPTKYFSVDIIDPTRLGVIELQQGFFADNTYEFDFSNGLLTRYKSDKPSEIVSLLAMIPAAAKALVEVPAELIQLKFDLSDKDRAYYEMQTAILKAQIENDVLTNNIEKYEASLPDALLAPTDESAADDASDDGGN